MSDLINKYPYTDFHSVNLDYILKVVRENAGLHLEISGNQLLLKTADNTIISAITIPYATEAGSANTAVSAGYASQAGSAASATYAATAGSATTATNATNAAHASSADTATSATSAASATNADYANTAGSATNATNAVNAQNAVYAETTGKVEHADKAIETITISGNVVRFTTYDGTNYDITIPYAVKAQKDDLGNNIKSTYFASVIDDNGTLKFKDAEGNIIASLTPTNAQASEDDYGNTIANYIKALSVSSDSNYVTVEHGDGTVDSIIIHYSDTAWKDSNGNVIKNTYIKRMEIVTDPDDGHKKLVAYNGDTPEAELFRFEIEAYSAQVADEATHAAAADYATNAGNAQTADRASNGDVITEYAKSFTNSSAEGVQNLIIKDGEGNVLLSLDLQKAANHYLVFEDIDPANPLNPLDASFTVGHNHEYKLTNLAAWGWDDFRDHFTDVGLHFRYRDENGVAKLVSPGTFYSGQYMFMIYDPYTDEVKAFSIGATTSPDTMYLYRYQ